MTPDRERLEAVWASMPLGALLLPPKALAFKFAQAVLDWPDEPPRPRLRPALPLDIEQLPDEAEMPIAWVEGMTGLAGTTIRNKARLGTFPGGLKNAAGGVRWRLGEVRRWLAAEAARKALRRPSAARPGPT